jgi:hypothetical protein
MNYDGYFLRALARLRIERRYRVFADLERVAGNYPDAIWHSPAGPRQAHELQPPRSLALSNRWLKRPIG